MSHMIEDASVAVRQPRSRWRVWVTDAVLVAILELLNAISVGPHDTIPTRTFAVTALVALPILVRRRWPVHVFAATVALGLLQFVLVIPLRPGDIAVLIALYTVTVTRGGTVAGVAAAISAVGLLAEFFQDPNARSWPDLIAPSVVLGATIAAGRSLRARRSYLRALEERAVRLERERDALARAAVAEERGRIAREMHDVIAHRVGVIVAQADGATYAFDAHPEQARAALDVIAASGRSALTELRQLLGVLRGGADVAGTAPQPGLADVDALVTEMRAAGLPVRFTAEGTAGDVSAGVGLTVYRLVQECLTNTLKHAGPGTPVEVLVRHAAGAVHVRVIDEGAELDGSTRDDSTDVGHGLIGMRERVTMLGGSFTATAARPRGWRVDATLPTSDATLPTPDAP